MLKACIEKIYALDDSAWHEDEIIGWICQSNNAEENVAIRRRGKPQTPHDCAVINQFFTPPWMVKSLVDNTLCRLWLEMHPDSWKVREKCDYLLPEPLAEQKPPSPNTSDSCSIQTRRSTVPRQRHAGNPCRSPRSGCSTPPAARWDGSPIL